MEGLFLQTFLFYILATGRIVISLKKKMKKVFTILAVLIFSKMSWPLCILNYDC